MVYCTISYTEVRFSKLNGCYFSNNYGFYYDLVMLLLKQSRVCSFVNFEKELENELLFKKNGRILETSTSFLSNFALKK